MKIHYHASERGYHLNGILRHRGRKISEVKARKFAERHAAKVGFKPSAIKSITILPYRGEYSFSRSGFIVSTVGDFVERNEKKLGIV